MSMLCQSEADATVGILRQACDPEADTESPRHSQGVQYPLLKESAFDDIGITNVI